MSKSVLAARTVALSFNRSENFLLGGNYCAKKQHLWPEIAILVEFCDRIKILSIQAIIFSVENLQLYTCV